MTVAIMQPYFFPYIGYYQLIHSADKFVVYDKIKYTKKGWINRNRILTSNEPAFITLPLRKASDSSAINQREVSAEFSSAKLLGTIEQAYRKAPHRDETMALLTKLLNDPETNLFRYLLNTITTACNYLGIRTPIVVSSDIDADHSLAGQDRVISICNALSATHYVNPIGGVELYSETAFAQRNIQLRFLRSRPTVYQQHSSEFCPWLSIIDVMMFNSRATILEKLLNEYDVLTPQEAAS